MKHIRKLKKGWLVLVVLMLVAGINLYIIPKAFAGTLSGTTLVELGGASGANPMVEGANQSLALEFTEPSTVSSPTITLTFTGWNGASSGAAAGWVNTTQAASTNGCTTLFPGSPTAVGGTLSASGTITSGNGVITITGASTLSSSTTYCTELTSTSAVSNPTSTGDYSVTISDGTNSQTVSLDVLSSTGNGYTITATVGPTFTMSLGATSDSITGLNTSGVTVSSGVTTTVSTNARSGWIVWVRDSTGGLHSTQASTTIATVPADTNEAMNGAAPSPDPYGYGSASYALGAVSGSGSPTIASAYAYNSGTTGGGLSTSTLYELASNTSAASGNTFTTHELVNIASTTPAATDYTDIIYEIGSGSF